MITGIDVAVSQRSIDMGAAYALGHRACYVKWGGANAGEYLTTYGPDLRKRAQDAGFVHNGRYWNSGQGAVLDHARRFVDALTDWHAGDFVVLDNEPYPEDSSGRLYTDDEVAAWVLSVASDLRIPTSEVFVYMNRANATEQGWPKLTALATKPLVAYYGAEDGTYPGDPGIKSGWAQRWAGHQWTQKASIGGVTVDLNRFQDWAFDRVQPIGAAGWIAAVI